MGLGSPRDLGTKRFQYSSGNQPSLRVNSNSCPKGCGENPRIVHLELEGLLEVILQKKKLRPREIKSLPQDYK